jgi:hypothetical protein
MPRVRFGEDMHLNTLRMITPLLLKPLGLKKRLIKRPPLPLSLAI